MLDRREGWDRERPEPVAVVPEIRMTRLALAFLAALALVVLTRWPVARSGPIESDEFGFLDTIARYRLPMHHTLFLASGRVLGQGVGDAYAGFLVLDMVTSALALTAVWWWLRALVRPATAVAATAILAFGPVFWGYGAMAGNYTAIPLVSAILLGIAVRAWDDPRPWHPYVAAVVLALGTGYRQDIGTLGLPLFFLILGRHRWRPAIGAVGLFTALNLAWIGAMLLDVGGWERFRAATAEFSREAGYRNSVWYLGLVDAPVRYGLKLVMALTWTLGASLLLVPWGACRLRHAATATARDRRRAAWVAGVLLAATIPPLGFHLLIHFGVPGYAFHYVPALLALAALGAEHLAGPSENAPARAPRWLTGIAALSAAVFLLYPTDYNQPGLRGNFDLSFARHTRVGLRSPLPAHSPTAWRTANSRPAPGERTNPSTANANPRR